jgi:AraC family transcriptional activator of pobA
LSDTHKNKIPLYSIEKFSRQSGKRQYEIEVFDINRDFKVDYPHRHDFYEILFITRGTGSHQIDFKNYIVKPNTIFFLSPGQIHSLSLSEDIYGYIFLFTSEFYLLEKTDKNKILELPFFYNISNENPPLELSTGEDISFLTNLFGRASNENIRNSDAAPELISSILDLILLYCKSIYHQEKISPKMKKGKLLVKKFKQLIEEKYEDNMQVKDYSSLLAVTPNHLNETVKNLMGRTASDLINEKMIIEIKKMLLYTDFSITEIADQLNFSDQSYFSRFFKNQTGLSPKEFRLK